MTLSLNGNLECHKVDKRIKTLNPPNCTIIVTTRGTTYRYRFQKKIQTYKAILGDNATNFWIIDSVIDLVQNLPTSVRDQ